MGTDQALFLFKEWKKLCDLYPTDSPHLTTKSGANKACKHGEVNAILEIGVGNASEPAPKGGKKKKKKAGEVQIACAGACAGASASACACACACAYVFLFFCLPACMHACMRMLLLLLAHVYTNLHAHVLAFRYLFPDAHDTSTPHTVQGVTQLIS